MSRFTQSFNFDIGPGGGWPRLTGQSSPRPPREGPDPSGLDHPPRRHHGPGANPARPLRFPNPSTTLLPLRFRL
jgi:hypothetical protein